MQRYAQDFEYEPSRIIKRIDGPYVLYSDVLADKEAAMDCRKFERDELLTEIAKQQYDDLQLLAERDKRIHWLEAALAEKEKDIQLLQVEAEQSKDHVTLQQEEIAALRAKIKRMW